MTLLTVKDLIETRRSLSELEEKCLAATGLTPCELGFRAFGLAPVEISLRDKTKVACIPVTVGNGILGDFCYIVAEIVEQLADVQATVTSSTDITGLEEAIWSDADILFLADDDTFVAYNTKTNVLSDNSIATGRIFATVLDCAADSQDAEEVLVLGAGKVGLGAYSYLSGKGRSIRWFDAKLQTVAGFDPALRCENWKNRSWKYLVDATTASAFIESAHLAENSVVAAPGIPFGLNDEAVGCARLVFHDNLAMGVVAMLCQALGTPGKLG